MNGDHREIYEKIQSLELKVLDVKKDTKFIRKLFNDHLKRFEKMNNRVGILEAWRYRVLGATTVVGAVGFFAFIKSMGIW